VWACACNCISEFGKFTGPLTASALIGGRVDRMESSLTTVSAPEGTSSDMSEAADDGRIVSAEDGFLPGDELGRSACSAERLVPWVVEMACWRSSGIGTSNACATAAIMAEALGKRF